MPPLRNKVKPWIPGLAALDILSECFGVVVVGSILGAMLAIVLCIAFDVSMRPGDESPAGWILFGGIVGATILYGLATRAIGSMFAAIINCVTGSRGRSTFSGEDSQ